MNQVELLRLTSDQANLTIERKHSAPISIEFCCSSLQLDNQMFDVSSQNTDHNIRYDFPVIFLPRTSKSEPPHSKSPTITYQTFDAQRSARHEPQSWSEKKANRFVCLRLCLMPNQNESHESLRLTEVDVDIKSFELYLEDYFIYNLVNVGIEFISLVHSNDDATSEMSSVGDEQRCVIASFFFKLSKGLSGATHRKML